MILILNGPPGIGKDTIANLLEKKCDFKHITFKKALYQDVADFFGLCVDDVITECTHRELKERPSALFNWRTPREALIHVSEDIMKKEHGPYIYGHKLAMQIEDGEDNYIVSDGGFDEEIQALIDDDLDVVIIRLYADGFNFDGDSRKYITAFEDITFNHYVNRGNPEKDVEVLIDFIVCERGSLLLKDSEQDYEPDDTPYVSEDEDYEGERI